MRQVNKFLLCLTIVFCSSLSYALTVEEIFARVRVNIQDQALSRDVLGLSNETLLRYANDGQRETNILAWLLEGKTTVYLTSGTQEYALPVDFLTTDRVIYNNIRIAQTSLNQLDTDLPGWLASVGSTPQKYYVYPATTSFIGFVPKPSSTTTSVAVYVYYVKQPIELTSLSDVPWNGWKSLYAYHTSLVYYVTYRAFEAIGNNTVADKYYQEWSSSILNMRHGIYSMPDFNPGFQGQRK
jgi:hypothetical protein